MGNSLNDNFSIEANDEMVKRNNFTSLDWFEWVINIIFIYLFNLSL